MDDGLRIGDLARLAGVSARTIRHYESLGLLPPPDRRANGYRRYRPDAVLAIAEIRRLRTLGMSLSAIAEARREGGDGSLLERVRTLQTDVDQEIAGLQARREALDELEAAVEDGESILATGGSELFESVRVLFARAGASAVALGEARRVFSALEHLGLPDGWTTAVEDGIALLRRDEAALRAWVEALELIAGLRDVPVTDARVGDAAKRLAAMGSSGSDVRSVISFGDQRSVAIVVAIASCFSPAQVAAVAGAATEIGVVA